MHRVVQAPAFQIHYVHNRAEWNPGLNAYVKNEAHKRELMRKYRDQTGSELVEIGNENPRKHYEPIEKKHEKEWDSIKEKIAKA